MMARRIPPEEWDRIERANGMPLFPGLRREDVCMVGVESDAGEIVASMAIFRATHMENLWIHPEHRNAGVARGLIGMSSDMARLWGSDWVFGAAKRGDERMRDILTRVGGVPVPIDTYILSLKGKE